MSTIRLDKYLADAGIGTRSEVKNYIKKKMVMVNGTITTHPEYKVNSDTDSVTFQGDIVSLSEFEYYILNKPAGYVTATKDNVNPTVMSLIKASRKDLAPVGRLDKDTEGLLLITNDGELAHRLLSPKHHAEKTYYAVLNHFVDQTVIDVFSNGIEVNDSEPFKALPAKLEILNEPLNIKSDYYDELFPDIKTLFSDGAADKESPNSRNYAELGYVLITICEGKYHQVKRMFKAVDREVLYLRRISFAGLSIPDDLASGDYCQIKPADIYNN